MEAKIKTREFSLHQKLIHNLILQSSFINNIGLFNGKTGIALTFAHFQKVTNNEIFNDIAYELIEQVIEQMDKSTDISLSDGLSGVGWGIEYLIQSNFFDGNSIEICKEIDKVMMTRDFKRIHNYSVETGIEGLLHYILIHIKGCMQQESSLLPFDKMYMQDIWNTLNSLSEYQISDNLHFLSDKFKNFYLNEKIDYTPNVIDFTKQPNIEKENFTKLGLGINGGISAILLNDSLQQTNH